MTDEAGRARAGVAAVVLAAGASRRMGEPKQLLRLAGESLVRRAARAARAAGCAPVWVVLGANAEAVARELADLDVRSVTNPDFASGMGSSIRTGVRVIESRAPDAAAVLVLPCDQPLADADVLAKLLAAWRSGAAPIVASAYAGRLGPPAVFARTLFPALRALEGDRGARALLRGRDAGVTSVPFPDGALDIDTPEDYAKALERAGNEPSRQ